MKKQPKQSLADASEVAFTPALMITLADKLYRSPAKTRIDWLSHLVSTLNSQELGRVLKTVGQDDLFRALDMSVHVNVALGALSPNASKVRSTGTSARRNPRKIRVWVKRRGGNRNEEEYVLNPRLRGLPVANLLKSTSGA